MPMHSQSHEDALAPQWQKQASGNGHNIFVQEELTGLLVNYRAWRGAMESYPWAEDQYFVVLHKGEWKIKHNRRHSHPYETQADAMRLTLRTEREGCLRF
jgi:hypothetical protein